MTVLAVETRTEETAAGTDREVRPAPAKVVADDSVQPNQPSNAPTAATRIAGATHGVRGSAHDFSMLTGKPGDLCSACHVPHVLAVGPGKADGEAEPFSLAFYRLGGQRAVLEPDRYMPGPTSLICLSCHNGALAVSTLPSSHLLLSAHRAGFTFGEFSTRDHPIGIEYPARLKGYRSASQVGAAGIPLPEGRIECVSCHDPHNERGEAAMLVMSNRRSALCLACHEK
jgi:predicted CXXCH cytochrome family protein